ncbi:MAG: V-type ATP synthase subunit E [Poseidonia sp.]
MGSAHIENEDGDDMMTLETLANDIAAAAEKDAKALIAEAKAEAKQLLADAEAKASALRDEAQQRAEKEATQIARETVASARQSNQKDVLIARRKVLDATYEAARTHIADPGMKGRAALLKTLLSQSKKLAKGKFVILPVEVDRAAISKEAGDRKVGESVDGLGGFVLEAEDGSVSFDMRFDNMLERAWSNQLAAVNETLFG